MIKHLVFWNLKEEAMGRTKAQNAAVIKERLEALCGQIDGLLKAEVGVNFNPKGWDLCLYSEFASREALEVYQNHPLHLAVRRIVTEARTDRAVCDYEV